MTRENDLLRIYAAIDGIESYVFGALLHSLRMLPTRQRVQPADGMGPIHITGPDLRDMFLSASAEKGIRFQFALDTPAWYRDTFWRLFCDYVEGMAAAAKERKWALDPEPSRRSRQWWSFAKQSLPRLEANSGEFVFGILIRSPDADRK